MRAICVDDEALVLKRIVSLCEKLTQIDEVEGFVTGRAALDWLEEHFAEVALLDINMPDMSGLILAAHIKEKSPDTRLIFLTGYPQYAVDAFAMHVSGYLMKPVSMERLSEEVEYALSDRKQESAAPSHIEIKTFGTFEVFVDGEPVAFKRSKSKELLAYLVDRNGDGVNRKEAFSILWEEKEYDHSMQKQLDVIIRSMRDTLKEYGISEIFELKHGTMRIFPERFSCELYRFLRGDVDAINSYRGEYMNTYPWALLMEGYITEKSRV